MRKGICILWLMAISMLSIAQSDSTSTQGQVVTSEIIIEKNKQIILPKADKIYLKGELKSFGNDPIPVQPRVVEPSLEWPPYKTDVPAASFTEKYPVEAYPNYIRLGYGNYSSPVGELGIFHRLGSFDTRSIVFYERFGRGPVNDENSESKLATINLSAIYQSGNIKLSPFINYQYKEYRFYGNTDRLNTPFRSELPPAVGWSDFTLGVSFKGQSDAIQYSVKPFASSSYQTLKNDDFINRESVFGFTGDLEFNIDTHFTTGFNIEGYTAKYESGISYDRSLFLITPWLRYKKDEITLKGGFNVSSGKSQVSRQSGFYPKVSGEWAFDAKWSLYGVVSGGVQWNGWSNLLTQNEFLDDSLSIFNIEVRSEFGGGIKGSINKKLMLDANLMLANLEKLPIYVPSATDSSRYTVTYDDEPVSRVKLDAQLDYSPTSISTYGASLEVYSYSVSSLDRPWHLPGYVFSVYTSHNIKEKLIVSANILAMGGIKAPANINFGIANLDAFADVGLKARYLITNRASAFINVDNLFNNEYERYLGYPVRGLTFKIGGQYRF